MEVKTTVEKCLSIVRLLKGIGIFPCPIVPFPKTFELTPSISPRKHSSFQVDRSWTSCLFRGTIQTYFGMRLLFGYIQLLRTAVSSVHYNFPLMASALAASLIGTCVFGVTLVANQRQKQLALLLNQWQQTEMEIVLLSIKSNSLC